SLRLIGLIALSCVAITARGQESTANGPLDYRIELTTVHSGYDRLTCFVHARAAAIPGNPPSVVITTHPIRISGTDVFYAVHDIRTDNGGKTWSSPTKHADSLGRRKLENGLEEAFINPSPKWHAKTGVVLCIGDCVVYRNDALDPHPRPVRPGYTVYDPKTRTWTPWKRMKVPLPMFHDSYCGSDQRIDLANGDILLPAGCCLPGTAGYLGNDQSQQAGVVMHCTFDGKTMRYVKHGAELTMREGGGYTEPSATKFKGKYYLTLRSNKSGYVTTGEDGLNYNKPIPWTFDDGSNLGNYKTQQHWVTHSDGLFLAYTRRGANNNHIFRHRAPLFIAQVNPQRLHVIRSTERVLVPQRGARVGNFGVVDISPNETWVTAAEWMQTKAPHWFDPTICEKHGSDNRIFVAKIKWNRPNKLAQADGEDHYTEAAAQDKRREERRSRRR
ncbi:MAG: sialidase family protein, partial [Planctomycetota bacterium]|nr:sialidase family protein [Planctomycetota bacterium]